jgi:predicted nucleic acid-binding protein
MTYVLDSSVAVKWLIPETLSEDATKLRDDFRKGLLDLIAPDILPIEVAHALTRAEWQGRVSTSDGFILWTGLMQDSSRLVHSLSLMPRAYAMSSHARIGVYDCLYVALAEQEQCSLVTADQRLVGAFPNSDIVSLASL